MVKGSKAGSFRRSEKRMRETHFTAMHRSTVIYAAVACATAAAGSVYADSIVLSGNDGNGATTSFNGQVGNWYDNTTASVASSPQPVAGNTYEVGYNTSSYLIRTPNTASTPYTFAGNSLQLDGNGGNAVSRLLLKGTGGQAITINSLILKGGLVDTGVVDTFSLAGNISLTGGNSSYLSAQANSTLTVASNISGNSPITFGTNGLGVGSGAASITDNGTVNLTGSNTFGGEVIVGNGTFGLGGTFNLTNGGNDGQGNTPAFVSNSNGPTTITGTGTISEADIGWGASNVLNLASSGTVNFSDTNVGLIISRGNNNGLVNQTSGTVNAMNTGGTAGGVDVGRWDGGSGAYDLIGGTLNAYSLSIGGYDINGNGGNNTGANSFIQSGGTVNVLAETELGANGTSYNLLSVGGTFNQTAGSVYVGHSSNNTDILSVGSGNLTVSNGNIVLANGGSGETAILNLNGGVTNTNAISTVSGGTSILNFNGGTLQANANSPTSFVTGLTKASIYSGGATIDTNGQNVTIAQPLLATGGTTGVSSISFSAGAGYISAPVVEISGTGTGATAVATISGGVVTGITITSPGTGYTGTPTVSLSGGLGAGGTAATGTVSTGTNPADGGLNKVGLGMLTLSGSNTYSGPTSVSAGTFNLTGTINNSAVTVANGATLTGTGRMASLAVNGGGAAVLTTTGPLTVNGALSLGGSGSYGSGNYSTLSYILNTLEPITASGVLTLNPSGTYIALSGTPTSGTYNLLNFASQTSTGSFSLSPTAIQTSEMVGRNIFSLSETATALQLVITGAGTPGAAYFDGEGAAGNNTVWNYLPASGNVTFSTDLAGGHDAGNVPGSTSDVILNASTVSGAVAETLGASTTINSLNVNGNATTTIAADGSTLTINGLADSNHDSTGLYTGNTAGTGISIASTANAFTINAPIVVGGGGANQTWINASGNIFQVNGTITGSAPANQTQALTLTDTGAGNTVVAGTIADPAAGAGNLSLNVINTGAGTVVLRGSDTFTGGTTVQQGTLILGAGGSLSTANILTLGGGTTSGTFQMGDSSGPVSTSVAGLTTAGTGTSNAIVTGPQGNAVLTFNNSSAVTYTTPARSVEAAPTQTAFLLYRPEMEPRFFPAPIPIREQPPSTRESWVLATISR